MNDNVVEQQLEQYHRLASELRNSTDIDEAGPALHSLVNMAQADQIAYLKALGREDSSDAADIAQAMYNLAPDKEVRKEARSALVRLEARNVYPQWTVTPEGLVVSSEITPESAPSRERTDLQDETLSSLNSLLQDLEDFFDNLPNTPTLEPVTALLESWAEGDPEEAYNALSLRSPLREGLDIDAWIERRTKWSEAADTGLVKITYVGEKDQLAPDCVVVEATWSLPIGNPTVENPPKDLPTATCVSKETGRHWFWTSYVVVEEDEGWRITDMTDEGAMALQLPLEEIERVLREKAAKASQLLAELEDEEEEDFEDSDEDDLDIDDFENEEDSEDFDEDGLDEDFDEEEEETLNLLQEMEEVIREATQAMHYHDAFIHQAPNDSPVVYESAVEFAQIVQDIERAAVYFQQMAQNLPEVRGKALRGLAIMYEQTLQDYLADNPEDPEPEKQRYNTLIEETLRQAMASDRTTRSHILLADVLIRQNKNLDEAKTLLKTAQPSATEDDEIISIEAGLAQIAQSHNQKEEALQHYQTVVSLDAEFPHIWFKIGSLQRQLGNTDEAILNLRRSIKQEPELAEAHIELSVIYSEQKQFSKARDILRKALDKLPDSVDLLASLSIVYTKSGDLRSAQRYLEQAEMIDEHNSFVPIARATLQSQKEQRPPTSHVTPKDRHQPRPRSHKNRKK